MENNEIIYSGGIWYNRDFLEAHKKFQEKMMDNMYHTFIHPLAEARQKVRNRRQKLKDDFKYCYVLVGKTQKLCFINNKTQKVYKCDGYSKTWIEVKKFTFLRYCTTFDL